MLGRLTLMLAALCLIVVGCGSSSSNKSSSSTTTAPTSPAPASPSKLAPLHGPYNPKIDPANFVTTIDNKYLPFKPGTGFHYRGVKGSSAQRDDEVVTHKTKQILGVTSVAVRDTVSEHGSPIEKTTDYYAQDKQGNVWYMGEDAYEKKHGRFALASDSWRGGVKGGKPGIIMPANPQPGDRYRQEYYPPGQALDEATVLHLDGSVKVPYGSFKKALVTSEYSPLEPQTEQKYYVAGVGEVKEMVVKGGHEEFRLVNVTH